MSRNSSPRLLASLVLLVLAGSVLLLGVRSTPAFALQPTPAATPVAIANEVLGRAVPAAIDDPELALGRVTVMPGTALPVHHHPGTQIGVIVQGTLTYVVHSGEVGLVRASSNSNKPESIAAGETVEVYVGDALIEPPGVIHQGRNDGDIPVVIYLSTLFPASAPRAILDNATPTP